MAASKRPGEAGGVKPWADALLRELKRATSDEPDVVPDGWHTAEQWAVIWQLSQSHARRLILSGLAKGMLEMRRFRVRTASRSYKTPHYRRRRPAE